MGVRDAVPSAEMRLWGAVRACGVAYIGQFPRRLELGHQFAEKHGLPELATRLAIAIAMGVPHARLPSVLEQEPERFRRYCSGVVYPRVGVGTLLELITRIWDHERRELSSRFEVGD